MCLTYNFTRLSLLFQITGTPDNSSITDSNTRFFMYIWAHRRRQTRDHSTFKTSGYNMLPQLSPHKPHAKQSRYHFYTWSPLHCHRHSRSLTCAATQQLLQEFCVAIASSNRREKWKACFNAVHKLFLCVSALNYSSYFCILTLITLTWRIW